MPQELGTPEQLGPGSDEDPATVEAKVENFFSIFSDPHFGHGVPCQLEDRTKISLSRSQLRQ